MVYIRTLLTRYGRYWAEERSVEGRGKMADRWVRKDRDQDKIALCAEGLCG